MERRRSSLTDQRLELLYTGEGFGGETTTRARVIRELVTEIRALRAELEDVRATMEQADIL